MFLFLFFVSLLWFGLILCKFIKDRVVETGALCVKCSVIVFGCNQLYFCVCLLSYMQAALLGNLLVSLLFCFGVLKSRFEQAFWQCDI